nr:hypothetical protein [Tanacetum cinerariifolium]
MSKYGVTHRLSTAYHPQKTGQVEVTNRGLKRILKRTVGENRAHGLISSKTLYGRLELHSKLLLVVHHIAGNHRKLQLNELSELRDQAYENSLIYEERTKKLQDEKIKNRIFNVGDQVLLFNSRLKIFLEVDAVGDLRVDNFIQNSKHEYSESEDFDFDNPLLPLPPPKSPDKEFDFEIDFQKEISVECWTGFHKMAMAVFEPQYIDDLLSNDVKKDVVDGMYACLMSQYHPLEQVIRNPSQSIRTRRQLETDGEMYMFSLTMSQTEPKNIKEAMVDSSWIEAIQE